jgi:hypothetical protein
VSFWVHKKDKTGKKHWWAIDIDIMFATMIIGLLMALAGPRLMVTLMLTLPFALVMVGLIFLIISKISLFRQGIWSSFGPAQMTRGYARLYKFSYVFIGTGSLLLLFILINL